MMIVFNVLDSYSNWMVINLTISDYPELTGNYVLRYKDSEWSLDIDDLIYKLTHMYDLDQLSSGSLKTLTSVLDFLNEDYMIVDNELKAKTY